MKKNKKGTILAGIFALVLLITVGYATVIANIDIKGIINIPGWNDTDPDNPTVQNYKVEITSANLDPSSTAFEASSSATLSNNNLTAEYTVKFMAKDQVAIYDIVIENKGKYAVEWNAAPEFENLGSLPVSQKLELVNGGTTETATVANSSLAPGASKTYRLTVTMTVEQPERNASGTIETKFDYKQV